MHCEETIRGMARARQDYNRLHNYLDHKIATLEADNEKLSSALAEKDAEIAKLQALIEQFKK